MRRLLTLLAFVAATAAAQQPFTLQQVLSAPYSTNLTAAPVGNLFAWVEDAEGVHNIWLGGANQPAHQLTHYTQDDAQDIASLTWSPDGKTLAYVYGAETGASGRPANPAHLQRPTPVEIILQPVDGGDTVHVGEGRAPLYEPLNHHLLFLRGGQIWSADLDAVCSSATGCKTEIPQPSIHQLLFDRGTASSLTLSPDGKILAYISHRRTHSFLALYNLITKELTFPAPSTGDDSAPSFSRDGKHLAWLRFPFTDAPEFAGNRTSPNPWSIQILNVATNETRTLFQPEANKPGSAEPRMSTGEPRLLWASENRIIFFSEQSGYLHPYIISVSSGKPRDLLVNIEPQLGTLGPPPVEVEDAIVSKDGKSLIYASAGPLMVCVSHRGCDHNFADWNAKDVRTIWRVDIEGTKELAQRPLPASMQIYLAPPTPDVDNVRSFHLFLRDPLTPYDVIATHPVQLADGTLAALVSSAKYPMHPAILTPKSVTYTEKLPEPLPLHPSFAPPTYPATSLVQPMRVVFNQKGDDLREWVSGIPDQVFPADPDHIHGQLFLPKGVEFNGETRPHKHPAILFFHGGPKRQMLLGYPAMDYYSNAYAMNQYLTSRGYIVLSVNYRGGIGYGLDFRQCQHCGADGAAEYNDALGAVAYLRSRPDVDIAHIGIWGGSYGGYFTALALARNSDLFAAGVDFHGVHEWAREDNAAADWLRGPLAEQEKIAAVAHASSPMADVDKWKSPVLLIHGDDDPEVAYTQTPMLADALRARGVHVEELIFPDELHGFLLHKDWLAAYEAAANFFDRTLKPASTPSK